MLSLQDVTYIHPNGDVLFSHIHFSIQKQQKIALIGHNGAGKSTLLHILAGNLHPNSGLLHTETRPYYVPQLFDWFEQLTVAQALGVAEPLHALRQILDGHGTEAHLARLNDDWTLEERIHEAFVRWGLQDLSPDQGMHSLSGGQKTRVFLAGIDVHRPELVLLDEPSNHLDVQGRELLYEYVNHTRHTLIVVSHDKTLLNLLPTTYELSKHGITVYGGNHDFYVEQKKTESAALEQDLKSKEKALRKAKEVERETLERQQKLDARGKQKQEKAGLPTISMKTFKNLAEKSSARSKAVHAEKTENLSQELQQLRAALPNADQMKLDLDNSALHRGKILFHAKQITLVYNGVSLWKEGLDFTISSGERVAIKGPNGSGKTSLLRLLMGQMEPTSGNLYRAEAKAVYMDQHYTSVNPALSVYEQAQQYNTGALQEHEVKIRLNRFLFPKADWGKPCAALSGGEKMRLMLCCLAIGNQAPDLVILDEPSNNLDMQNLEMLATAMNSYQGTLLVVCHDAYFLERMGIERSIDLA